MPGGINWTGAIRWPTWLATQAAAYSVGFWLVWTVNIGPLFEHHKDAEAWTNIVLLLLVPFIASSRKRSIGSTKFWKGVWIAAIMSVCYYNSVGGVSEGKDTHIEQRANTQTTIGDWETALHNLDEAKGKIPDHKPIKESQYKDAKDKRDLANQTRDRECDPEFLKAHLRDRTNSQAACDTDRQAARDAQRDFDDASERWGYEQALADIEQKTQHAEAEKLKLGPKPMSLDPAAQTITDILFFKMISAKWLSAVIPLILAGLADMTYALGSPLAAKEMSIWLAEMWGEDWQRQKIWLRTVGPAIGPQLPVVVHAAPTPDEELPPPDVVEPPPPKPERTPTLMIAGPTPKKASRDEYVAGVLAWLKGVTQTPEGERYTPSQLHLVYAKYAEKEGFPVAPPNIFGSIVRNEGKLTTRKTKGQDYFRVAIRGASIKLVKTDLRTPTPTPSGPTPCGVTPTPTYAVGAPKAVS